MSPLLRPEQRQHLLSRGYWAFSSVLGSALARRIARGHPALDQEAAYQAWLRTQAPFAGVLPSPASIRNRPLVSILMPVFEAPEAFLRAAIGSLVEQSYPEWELCAADGGPNGSVGSRVLQELARGDGRIRVIPLDRNRGIAGNSNEALRMARGEFVALLDQDDQLELHALLAMVARLDEEPLLDLVYSDKDNLTPWGDRYAPFFKPGWSPELFLSANYLAQLTLVRRAQLDAVGGFDETLDGAQDWDLLLRVTERTSKIAHVPRVLYHWRALPTSCASSLDAKPYARDAQRRAVQAHLDRRGIEATVDVTQTGQVRIDLRSDATPSVTVILAQGVTRAEAQGVMANGLDVLDFVEDPRQAVQGEMLLVWDARFRPDDLSWARQLVLWARNPEIGAASGLALDSSGRVDCIGSVGIEGAAIPIFAGARTDAWTPLGRAEWYRNVLAPSPRAFATRRELCERLGGLEASPQGILEYGIRLRRAGLRTMVVPTVRLMPRGPGEASPVVLDDSLRGSDPCFNPSLAPSLTLPTPREG